MRKKYHVEGEGSIFLNFNLNISWNFFFFSTRGNWVLLRLQNVQFDIVADELFSWTLPGININKCNFHLKPKEKFLNGK